MWPFRNKQLTNSGISGVSSREDPPEFKRAYKAKLDSRASIEITFRTSRYLGRDCDGILRQPEGNHIFFQPNNIAKKIIDPTLIPLVVAYVDEIKALDIEFMKFETNTFVDDKGTKWTRVKGVA